MVIMHDKYGNCILAVAAAAAADFHLAKVIRVNDIVARPGFCTDLK